MFLRQRWFFNGAIAFLLGSSVLPSTAGPGDQNWDGNFGLPAGLDGTVYAVVADRGSLYVGGQFTHAGAVEAHGIARWDGTNWSALGGGVSGTVFALAVMGTNLYAGGWFDSAGGNATTNIAMWDGASWHDLQGGTGPNSPRGPGIFALAVKGEALYAGGTFVSIGGIPAINVARWDSTGWHSLGEGVGEEFTWNTWDPTLQESGCVQAMTFVGEDLYAGGAFSRAGAGVAKNVAKWNGTSWTNLGDGITDASGNGYVFALQPYNGSVWAGGLFTSAGGLNVTNLALWNGSSWQEAGGVPGTVSTLVGLGGGLYAGGDFWSTGGVRTRGIARWDGVHWNAVASGVSGSANAICALGTNLVVGGSFGAASGTPAAFVAQFSGSAWSPIGAGAWAASNALVANLYDAVVDNGPVYVAGSIASAGTNDATCLAKWDGTNWCIPGGTPLRGWADAVAVEGSKIYLAGGFTAPELGITNLACWNGSSWLGLGVESAVHIQHLLLCKGRLFASGWFNSIGGVNATNLAMWDGTNWSAVGSGLGNGDYSTPFIDSLVTDGQSVYVSGSFMSADGLPARNISVWDGTNWFPLGSGPVSNGQNSSEIWSLALYRGQLFAFAEFFSADYSARWTDIQRWDGANWSAIPNPFGPGDVFKIAANRNYLYAYGFLANGGPTASLSKWAGADWLPMGTGLSGIAGSEPALVLAVADTQVCVAGLFGAAGDKPSYAFALWHEPPAPTITGAQKLPDGTFGFQLLGSEGQKVEVQSSSNLIDWQALDVRSLGTPVQFLDGSAALDPCRFYRLIEVP